jgi:hypothetical protein
MGIQQIKGTRRSLISRYEAKSRVAITTNAEITIGYRIINQGYYFF